VGGVDAGGRQGGQSPPSRQNRAYDVTMGWEEIDANDSEGGLFTTPTISPRLRHPATVRQRGRMRNKKRNLPVATQGTETITPTQPILSN